MAEIFFGVGLDATLRDDETKEHAPRDPKNTLLGIEFDAVCSEFCKGPLKIGYEMVIPFGLDHDVVNVGLNGLPDEVPETLEHTALVCSPSVLQTERNCDVAERSEGVMKDVMSWSDSFIVI